MTNLRFSNSAGHDGKQKSSRNTHNLSEARLMGLQADKNGEPLAVGEEMRSLQQQQILRHTLAAEGFDFPHEAIDIPAPNRRRAEQEERHLKTAFAIC
jgi:hypothetical protein